MDYKKKYEQALVNARQEYNTTVNVERKKWLEELFPELKETEAECVEKIKKDIISYLNNRQITSIAESNATARWLSWLEKQGEPVSNDLEEAATKYARKQLSNPDYPTYNDEYEMECAFEAGAQWQKQQLIDKACEWLQGFMECSNLFEYEVSESEQKEVINEFKQIMEK